MDLKYSSQDGTEKRTFSFILKGFTKMYDIYNDNNIYSKGVKAILCGVRPFLGTQIWEN